MQNERLFKKIRSTALRDTSGTEEFDPEKIWTNIEKRSNHRSLWVWWPHAAASIIFLAGISFWLSKVKQAETYVINEAGKIESPSDDFSKNGKEKVITPGQLKDIQILILKEKKHPSIPVKQKSTNPGLLPPTQYLPDQTLLSADILPPEGDVKAYVDTTTFKTITPVSPVEKVLIADISIPEQKTGEYSALQQIFDQARKDRQARKLRLQFNKEIKKPGLWSLVHHSFVQYPAVNIPEIPKKKTELPH